MSSKTAKKIVIRNCCQKCSQSSCQKGSLKKELKNCRPPKNYIKDLKTWRTDECDNSPYLTLHPINLDFQDSSKFCLIPKVFSWISLDQFKFPWNLFNVVWMQLLWSITLVRFVLDVVRLWGKNMGFLNLNNWHFCWIIKELWRISL